MDDGHQWLREDLKKLYLEDVRSGIPLAAEQLDVLLRIVRHTVSRVDRFLDLGCGDGILGRAVMQEYPAARGLFIDLSEDMIEAARKKADPRRADFAVRDLSLSDWRSAAVEHAPFDLAISGLAIHHLPDERKRELYGEIFELLGPGGVFLNLEMVAHGSNWARETFYELFLDSVASAHRRRGDAASFDEIATKWRERADSEQHLLVPVETQCQWLREIGFSDVDCFFKLFQLAIFGGRKTG